MTDRDRVVERRVAGQARIQTMTVGSAVVGTVALALLGVALAATSPDPAAAEPSPVAAVADPGSAGSGVGSPAAPDPALAPTRTQRHRHAELAPPSRSPVQAPQSSSRGHVSSGAS